MPDPLDALIGLVARATPLGLIPVGNERLGRKTREAVTNLPGIAKGIGEGIVDTATLPGRVAKGHYNVEPAIPGQWSEEDEARRNFAADQQVKDAGLFAANMAGARSPFVKPGEAGIFGGRLSPVADQEALKRAEQLQAAGATRDAIWTSTGWFQGADKKWRFEIPDNAATLRSDIGGATPGRLEVAQRIYADKGMDKAGPFAHPRTSAETKAALDLADAELAGNPHPPLREHVNHPELERAYPDVMGIETQAAPMQGRAKAAYWPHEPEMIQYGPTVKPAEDVSSLLHEGQHAIQKREGFASGGNTTGLRPGTPQWGLYQEILQNIRNGAKIDHATFSKMAGYPEGELSDLASYKQYVKTAKKIPPEIDRMAQETAVSQGYHRLAGEVESRNVQARRTMTPEERKAKPPWETQDVPDASQYVTFNKAGAAAEPQLAKAVDPSLKHPISDFNLRRPLAEAEAEHKFAKRKGAPGPQATADIADMEGKHLIYSPGDLSRADVVVKKIGGKELDQPVTAYGGYRYGDATPSLDPRAPSRIWRSDQGVISGQANLAREVQEQGLDAILATGTMSPQSIGYSHHSYEPIPQLLKKSGGFDRKYAPELDAAIREPAQKKPDKFGRIADKGIPDWPGINDPGLGEYLRSESTSGKAASKMAKELNSKWAYERGAPDIAEIRHAFTAPELLNVPAGHVGHNFALVAPGAPMLPGRKGFHATTNYDTDLLGTQLGGFGRTMPAEVMFKELVDKYRAEWARRGLPPERFRVPDLLTRGMVGMPRTQLVTPQVVERISQWLERNPPPPR